MRNKRIEYIIDEILDQYAYADESTRPWIIGFSGGIADLDAIKQAVS